LAFSAVAPFCGIDSGNSATVCSYVRTAAGKRRMLLRRRAQVRMICALAAVTADRELMHGLHYFPLAAPDIGSIQ
jgi:hypothetical protein